MRDLSAKYVRSKDVLPLCRGSFEETLDLVKSSINKEKSKFLAEGSTATLRPIATFSGLVIVADSDGGFYKAKFENKGGAGSAFSGVQKIGVPVFTMEEAIDRLLEEAIDGMLAGKSSVKEVLGDMVSQMIGKTEDLEVYRAPGYDDFRSVVSDLSDIIKKTATEIEKIEKDKKDDVAGDAGKKTTEALDFMKEQNQAILGIIKKFQNQMDK